MSREKVTRRDALGMIGKTGLTLSTGPFFFLSLGTAPLEGKALESIRSGEQVRPPKKPPVPVAKPVPKPLPEKVVISGSGSMLKIRISGPPGRHCGVAFALADKRESFNAVPGGTAIIGDSGICIIEVDTRKLPNRKLFVRVVTGSSRAFSENVRGTKAFEVVIARGVISGFGGVRERPLEGAASTAAAVASAGYQNKIRESGS